MTKAELVTRIKRNLGYPIIKLEISDDHINDNIDYAVEELITWAVGHATQETFFTVMLSAGQVYYDMPDGVVDVINYDISSYGGINTLFTVENYLYNNGMMDMLTAGNQSTIVDYHIALDFLATLKRYTPDGYNFKYHRSQNILEIQPAPESGNALQIGDNVYDSPGWILVRSYMIAGSQIEGSTREDYMGVLYEDKWVREYATALTKKTLGMIRRKFANYTSMGNQGIQMDGDQLVSEANEELRQLMDDVRNQDCHEGGFILFG